MIPIGDRSGLIGPLCWQIKNRWTRERSLAEWHRRRPDLSDDLFDELYVEAERCRRFVKLCGEPFCDLTATLLDLWLKAKDG